MSAQPAAPGARPGPATRLTPAQRRLRAVVVGGCLGFVPWLIVGITAGSGGTSAPRAVQRPAGAVHRPFAGNAIGLPGMTVQQIRTIAAQNQFRCSDQPAQTLFGERPQPAILCDKGRTDLDVRYYDTTHVSSVTWSCRPPATKPAGCDDFYASVVPIMFESRPGDLAAARAWVSHNMHSDAVTTIGLIDVESDPTTGLQFAAIG